MRRICVVADLHCGHLLGLTPPDWQMNAGDAARHRKVADMQKYLWTWYTERIKKNGPYDMLLCNGDAIDGKNRRQGGVELVAADREEQAEIAAACLRVPRAKRILLTYGTAYHTGEDGEDWEGILKDKVGAEKIESEGHYTVEGIEIAAKHFIGNSSSPVSRFTALSSAQVKQMLWAERGQQPKANLLIRSHIHRCCFIGEPGSEFTGWTTPALQAPGTKYGARQIDGLPVDFGFLVVTVDGKKISINAEIVPMKVAKCDVIKI